MSDRGADDEVSLREETFQTDDIATAEAIVQRLYPVSKLHESRRRFWFEQTTRGADGITLARFKITPVFERVEATGNYETAVLERERRVNSRCGDVGCPPYGSRRDDVRAVRHG